MKISVLYGGRLFFSLGNLFFPIYYYIFVIVNYGKDIRLRRIGLGNSSNLMKYRDKLFSPMAGHAYGMLSTVDYKGGEALKTCHSEFHRIIRRNLFFIFSLSVGRCRHFLFTIPAHTVFFLQYALSIKQRY